MWGNATFVRKNLAPTSFLTYINAVQFFVVLQMNEISDSGLEFVVKPRGSNRRVVTVMFTHIPAWNP